MPSGYANRSLRETGMQEPCPCFPASCRDWQDGTWSCRSSLCGQGRELMANTQPAASSVRLAQLRSSPGLQGASPSHSFLTASIAQGLVRISAPHCGPQIHQPVLDVAALLAT